MSSVDLDQAAIDSLRFHPDVRADLEARMDRVVAAAQATAPVRTGRYRASIHRVEGQGPDGAVLVVADVPYAIYVEHGTRQTDRTGRLIHPARFILTNAVDASGGDT